MPLDSAKLQHWIDNFYGYGRWDAPVRFIGYEEGGGADYKEVEQKLDYFYNNWPINPPYLSDIRKLHKHVECDERGYSNHYDFRFSNVARKQPQETWKHLIAFMKGYLSQSFPTNVDILGYQKDTLADDLNHHEALIELYPLPNPKTTKWAYQKKSWVDHTVLLKTKNNTTIPLTDREYYEHAIIDERIVEIERQLLANTNKVKVIVCYGRSHGFEKLKESKFWKGQPMLSCNKSIKFKYQDSVNGPLIVFINHPASNRGNKIPDWYSLGQWANQFLNGQNPTCP